MNKLIVLDLVRIMKVRYSPEMVISSINEETQEATCVWYDSNPKIKKTKIEVLPLNVLELVPARQPINVEDILSPLGIRL